MKADLVVRNYRCFDDANPLRLTLEQGVTALVGANNSGKSAVLRLLYELRPFWSELASLSTGSDLLRALAGSNTSLRLEGVVDPVEIFHDRNTRDLELDLLLPHNQDSASEPPQVTRLSIRVSRPHLFYKASVWVSGEPFNLAGGHNHEVHGSFLHDPKSKADLLDFAPLIQVSQHLANAMYIGSFRNAINAGGGKYLDLDVGTKFLEAWQAWQLGVDRAHNQSIQDVTDTIRAILRYEQLQVVADPEAGTMQISIDGRTYKLHELGGGLAQLVLVFGNAAIRKPSLIMIDEPELNLHPSLQLDFLTSLASYADGQLLFATHSIGLARSAADRIYSLTRSGPKSVISQFEETPSLPEFLGELSFGSYRSLGFDTVLLVEGVSDVKTMQQFLRALRKDHRIVILPLGGSQLINPDRASELKEVLRITRDVAAIVDSERAEQDGQLDPEREAFADLCGRLGIRVLVLRRRSIENYLSETAIKEVLGAEYRALGPCESPRAMGLSWNKNDNWRIARAMRFEEIRETDLGTFLLNLGEPPTP